MPGAEDLARARYVERLPPADAQRRRRGFPAGVMDRRLRHIDDRAAACARRGADLVILVEEEQRLVEAQPVGAPHQHRRARDEIHADRPLGPGLGLALARKSPAAHGRHCRNARAARRARESPGPGWLHRESGPRRRPVPQGRRARGAHRGSAAARIPSRRRRGRRCSLPRSPGSPRCGRRAPQAPARRRGRRCRHRSHCPPRRARRRAAARRGSPPPSRRCDR